MSALADPPVAKKAKQKEVAATGSPKREGQTPKMFYMDDDLLLALEAYRQSCDFPPQYTDIFAHSVREFLSRKGFWPPKKRE